MGAATVQTLLTRLTASEHRETEADIQASVRDLLLQGGLDLGDNDVRLEAPSYNRRRVDVELGSTVIEVKRDLAKAPDAAKEQLAGYLADRQEEHGGRYVGVLTDGVRWRAYRLPRDADELVEFAAVDLSVTDPDGETLLVWLDGILATQQAITPTPCEVARRLGAGSSATRLDLSELEWVYQRCSQDPGIRLKRELWGRLLTTAFGTSFDADDTALFLEHTYLVVLAKMVAHAVLRFDLSGGLIEPGVLLSGRLFADQGILGVVESDFFDWPAESEPGRVWVNNLARRVARFRWDSVEHDVLKVLYESVISRETRHALGEYYTPDWLARAVVDEVVDDPLHQRVLDPGCGSGTFVFWTVQRCLDACAAAGMSTAEAIDDVTSRVFGVDVHPVAVALARVTYLLAITTARLRHERPRFAVPVWLGDSVQYQRRDTLRDADALTIVVGDGQELWSTELRFPERVVDDIRWFDSLVAAMTGRAADRRPGSAVPRMAAVYDRHGVHPDDHAELDETMRTLCRLSDEGRNHVWGYYVRNEARPRWISRRGNRVDRLVGNPPWLAYRYMTAAMQKRFRELSVERGLWQGTKVATHQDLSALFLTRTVELYLSPGGRFGYLMPLAVLTRQAYEGFRTGRWTPTRGRGSGHTTVAFDVPWDLHDILPRIFPVPAAAVFGTRTSNDAARSLRGKVTHWSGRQPFDLDTRRSLSREDVALVQMPSDQDECSPYKGRFFQGATVVPRSLALVERTEAGPLGTPVGSVAVRAKRSAREKPPWRHLPTMSGVVEERFVYGLHVGPTVFAFRTLDPELAVLPWTGERMLGADDPSLDRWPGFAAWWREANGHWQRHRSKSAQDHDLGGWFDYHGKLSSQVDAVGSLRVVYTKSGQYLAAALVDDARAFIDHKLYWCRVKDPDEGRYVTAVLNAPVVLERLSPLQSRGEHNPRDFDKYVWALPVPPFDRRDDVHRRLVDLAAQAEQVAAGVEVRGARFETGRRRIREALVASGLAVKLDSAVDTLLLRASASA